MVLEQQVLVATTSFGRNGLFYLLVLLHIMAALVGFGSIGFAGSYAAGAYLQDDRPEGAGQDPGGEPARLDDGRAQPEPEAVAGVEAEGEGEEAVPDYETALARYEAALSEFERSHADDASETYEPSETVDEPAQTGVPTGDGPGDGLPTVDEAPVVEQEAVVDLVVQSVPATSAGTTEQDEEEELRRYFAHPARLWGFLVLVPFLGGGALAAQPNGKGLDQPWVFGALAVWLAATLVAGSLVVPALNQMRAVLLKSDRPEASPVARSALRIRFARAGKIASRSAAFCDVLFFVALALMIFRP